MTLTEFKEKYGKPFYLGDGLFVEYDGYHIILKTERNGKVHYIGLEPKVFDNLILYRKQFNKAAKTVEPG